MQRAKSPGIQLGTALSHSLPIHLSQTCWGAPGCTCGFILRGWDEHGALPSLAVPLLLCTRQRCFWSSDLHGEMEQERVLVAVLAPSNVSVGPWEYLLKVRLECVLTALTHSVIFRK